MQKKNEQLNSGTATRDINSKRIFHNPLLCSQFLRDNLNIPALKHVQPEDIEDVSERFQTYLGFEFEADSVKKIHLRDDEGNPLEQELYLISLIEHKSYVDYDVAMQMLKYMVCIWDQCAKDAQQKAQEGAGGEVYPVSKRKSFRYPLILPIVYYEGKSRWTADLHLHDRILMSDAYGQYLPDFQYLVVRNHDYSNEDLLARGNEMGLVMLINKVQSAEDFRQLQQISPERLDQILDSTDPVTKKIIMDTLYSLMIKMKLPVDEANEYMELVEGNSMGYLFENMEKIDIQAERRNTAQARAELAEAKEKLVASEEKLAESEKKLVVSEKKLAFSEEKLVASREQQIANILFFCSKLGCSRQETLEYLMTQGKLSLEEAEAALEQ